MLASIFLVHINRYRTLPFDTEKAAIGQWRAVILAGYRSWLETLKYEIALRPDPYHYESKAWRKSLGALVEE